MTTDNSAGKQSKPPQPADHKRAKRPPTALPPALVPGHLLLLNEAAASVQRRVDTGTAPMPQPDVAGAIERRRGLGQPLPGPVQTELETGLGTDLSAVRVHTDSTADELAQTVQAKAFTTGSDIFFRHSQYDPTSDSGKHLLAHEATHVRQQRQGPVAGTATGLGVSVSDPGDSFEREAESSADLFLQRLHDNSLSSAAAPNENGGGNSNTVPRAALTALQLCPRCGRVSCGCEAQEEGPAAGPVASPAVQRQAESLVSQFGITEEGQEALLSLQRQADPAPSSRPVTIQRILEGDELAAELALHALPEGVNYQVQGQNIVARRSWVAAIQSDINFDAPQIVAPKVIAELLRELKRAGPLSYVKDDDIEPASKEIYLQGPWPATYTWVPFFLALSVRATLGSPPGAPDVEWHRTDDSFTLTITRRIIDANKDKPEVVGAKVAAALEERTGLTLKSDGKDWLKKVVVYGIGKLSANARALVDRADKKILGHLFGADVWQQYLDEHPLEGGSGKGGSGPAMPPWARDLRDQVMALVTQERARPQPPADLPDALKIWYRSSDQQWFMNVWVYFDNVGKEKAHESIKLDQRETASALFVRVRAAAVKARQKQAETDSAGGGSGQVTVGGKPAPQWAQKLLAELEALLKPLRVAEPQATDLPSRLKLGEGESRPPAAEKTDNGDTPAAPPVNEEPVVLLVIEADVSRNSGDSYPLTGTLGWPLNPKLVAADLIKPIRLATAALRMEEYSPLEKPPQSPDALKPDVKPDDIAQLHAYPGVIKAPDMPTDGTTITNGQITFTMQLNYGAIHGTNQGNEMVGGVANAMLLVNYEWRLYDVSQVKNPGLEEGQTQEWPARRDWLHEKFVFSDEFKGAPLQRVDSSDTMLSKITGMEKLKDTYQYTREKEYKFPSTPGEFLVFCRAIQSRDKDGPQRAPSVAYYPLRTLTGETIASKPVNAVPDRMAQIRSELGNQELAPGRRKGLEKELKALETQEGQLLDDKTKDRLAETNQSLAALKELEDIMKVAPDKPDDPLSMRLPQHLKGLYEMMRVAHVSIEDMRQQFLMQKKQIEDLQKRIGIYSDMFKTGSPHQYRPEVALASKVTGQVYPFIMMLGEATGSTDGNWKFHLVDVTNEQTRGVYTGESTRQGTAGIDEAIHRAFIAFGEEAKYGEGTFAVRIPPRPNPLTHQPNIEKAYFSTPGPWQTVKKWLGYLAMAAGLAALIIGTVATGGTALAAAGVILGTFSGVVGAALAIDNIRNRVQNRRFAWDMEMVMDIVSIAGGVVALISIARIGAGMTRLRFSPRWIQGLSRTDEILYIYGAAEMAGTVVLTPIKLMEDLEKIENSDMPQEQKDAMKAELIIGAIEQGVMLLAGAHQTIKGPNPFKHNEYKTMVDRGWIDPTTMTFTDKAPPQVRGVQVTPPGHVDSGGSSGGQQPEGGGAKPGGGTGGQQPEGGGNVVQGGDSTPAGGAKPAGEGDAIAHVQNGSGEDNPIPVPGTEQPIKAPDKSGIKDAVSGGAGKEQVEPGAGGAGKQPVEPGGGGDKTVEGAPKSTGDQPTGEHKPVTGDGVTPQPAKPVAPEVAKAQDTIGTTNDFKKIRAKAKEGGGHLDPKNLQTAREGIITNAEGQVKPTIEKNRQVTIEFENLGSPGFNSDIDKTANARCDRRVQLEADVKAGKIKAEDVAPQLSRQEIQSEVQASIEAVQGMYEKLGNPDQSLDANFYTQLRENEITRFASPEEKQRINLDDQSTVSMAEMHKGMSKRGWEKFKKDQLKRLSDAGMDDRIPAMNDRFAAAEKMAADVAGTDINTLYKQLNQALAEGKSVQELRDLMAKIKLKEPDAYGTRAAVEDVVGSQQKGARHAGEMKAAQKQFESGDITLAQAQEVMAKEMDGTFKAFMDRRGGHPDGSAEHLHFLAQTAEASTGKLWAHTGDAANSYKQVRDAAKYFGRIQYAANEAGVASGGMSRDVARVVLAKYAPNAEAATLDALRVWARNNGHGNLVNQPSALRREFVKALRSAARDIAVEVRTTAEHSRPGAWESAHFDMPDLPDTPTPTGDVTPVAPGGGAAADVTPAGAGKTPDSPTSAAPQDNVPVVTPDKVHDANAVPEGAPARVEGPTPTPDKPMVVTRINEEHTVSIVRLEDGTYVIKLCSGNCPQLGDVVQKAITAVENNPHAAADVKAAWKKVLTEWANKVNQLEADIYANPNDPGHPRRLSDLGADIHNAIGNMQQNLDHLAATTTSKPGAGPGGKTPDAATPAGADAAPTGGPKPADIAAGSSSNGAAPGAAAPVKPSLGGPPAGAQIQHVDISNAPGEVPQPPVVLQFPDGTRVWRDSVGGPVRHESIVRPGTGRQHHEEAKFSATEHGNRPAGPRYERSHTLGQGTGFESPYAILDAPSYVNQTLQNRGIEKYMRDLARIVPAGTAYKVTTSTSNFKRNGLPTLRLGQIAYHLDIIVNGVAHPFLDYTITITGNAEHPIIKADPIRFYNNPQAQTHQGRATLPTILTQAVDVTI